MKIVNLDGNEAEIINEVVSCLKNGGMIIYPTETCYGIGVDATNPNAVEKLIKYKGSRKNKPISVAVCDKAMAKDYAEFNPAAENLFDNFLPGPITVVANGKHKVDARLESERGTLGVRYPKHDLALKIIRAFGKPITSTSANVSNGKTPYEIADILDNISENKKELIGLIIDAGRLPYHAPSTIVDTTLNTPQVLRQGEFVLDGAAKSYVSDSAEETINVAQEFTNLRIYEFREKKENACLVFALQGDLGAGKTQFAKGIAQGLRIKEKIKSPTFILCSEYTYSFVGAAPCGRPGQAQGSAPTKGTMYHIDTWRMSGDKELLDIGFEKMLRSGNVIVIEWGQKVFGVLKNIEKRKDVKVVWVKIEVVNENERKLMINN